MVKPTGIHINYPKLIDHAMRDMAKKLLKSVENEGLKGDHYFQISFLTAIEGVKLSSRVKQKYPKEMTIIIQHQFEDICVNETELSIMLSFDSIKEAVVIPFDAFTSFADPSTGFSLLFNPDLVDKKTGSIISRAQLSSQPLEGNQIKEESKILVLDNFRKK